MKSSSSAIVLSDASIPINRNIAQTIAHIIYNNVTKINGTTMYQHSTLFISMTINIFLKNISCLCIKTIQVWEMHRQQKRFTICCKVKYAMQCDSSILYSQYLLSLLSLHTRYDMLTVSVLHHSSLTLVAGMQQHATCGTHILHTKDFLQ